MHSGDAHHRFSGCDKAIQTYSQVATGALKCRMQRKLPEHEPASEKPAGSPPHQCQPCGSCVPSPGLLQGHGHRLEAGTDFLAGTSPGQCKPCKAGRLSLLLCHAWRRMNSISFVYTSTHPNSVQRTASRFPKWLKAEGASNTVGSICYACMMINLDRTQRCMEVS